MFRDDEMAISKFWESFNEMVEEYKTTEYGYCRGIMFGKLLGMRAAFDAFVDMSFQDMRRFNDTFDELRALD